MGLMSLSRIRDLDAEAAAIADHAAETAMGAAVEYWARQVSACALVEELVDVLGATDDAVWSALSGVPQNMAALLDSPQGWSALSGFVAATLSIYPPNYMPVVH